MSGRWPFVSGCQYADWIAGFCVATDKSGNPFSEAAPPAPLIAAVGGAIASVGTTPPTHATVEGGASYGSELPRIQAVWLPARDWRLEDTWHTAGLRGTGSHHVVLKNKMVPASHFADLVRGVPFVPGPLYAALPQFLPLLHAASALGMAEAVVSNLLDLAATDHRQLHSPVPMRDSDLFQFELGRVVADLRAARALFQAQSASHWQHAVAGTLRGETLLAESTQAAIWTTATCVRVANACFALAGGSVVYESSPLQHRLRDLHVAAQHARLQQRHYVSAGRLLLARRREIAHFVQ